jgi:hypothetical protein
MGVKVTSDDILASCAVVRRYRSMRAKESESKNANRPRLTIYDFEGGPTHALAHDFRESCFPFSFGLVPRTAATTMRRPDGFKDSEHRAHLPILNSIACRLTTRRPCNNLEIVA